MIYILLELLRDICRARLLAENAMFNPLESSDTDFFDLTPRLRVWIIYKLCCWKVEDEQAITDAIDIKVSSICFPHEMPVKVRRLRRRLTAYCYKHFESVKIRIL